MRDTEMSGSINHSDDAFLMLLIYPGLGSTFYSTVQQLGSGRQMVTFSRKMIMMMMMMTATNTDSLLFYQSLLYKAVSMN